MSRTRWNDQTLEIERLKGEVRRLEAAREARQGTLAFGVPTCGCGRVIPAAKLAEGRAKAKHLVCTECGARGSAHLIARLLEIREGAGEPGCRFCGCPEFHDGEDCPRMGRKGN